MDVQMPDGTIISGVPDNISQSELLSRYQSYAESNPSQPPEKEGAIYGVAANITPSLATGIGSLMQFPGQIADLVTGTAPGEKAGLGRTLLGTVIPFGQKTVQEAGEKLQEIGREAKTVGLKEKERERAEKIAAAEGELNKFGTAFAETITDPSLTYSFLFEQLPNAIGGGIGGLLTKAGGKLLFKNATQATLNSMGVSGAVVTSAAQQGADIGYNTYKDIYEQLVKDGMKPEEANIIAAQKGRVAAAEAGALSYATSKIPGAREFEKALFKGSRSAIPQAGVQGIAKGAAKGIIGGGISETGEELGGVFASNIGKQEVFPETELTGGMGEAAAMALIGGPIMEGTAGAINSRSQAKAAQALQQQLRQQQEQAQTTEAAPVAPVAPEQIAVPESESQRTDIMMAELEGRPLPTEEVVAEPAPSATKVAEPESQVQPPQTSEQLPITEGAPTTSEQRTAPTEADIVRLDDKGEPVDVAAPESREKLDPNVEAQLAAEPLDPDSIILPPEEAPPVRAPKAEKVKASEKILSAHEFIASLGGLNKKEAPEINKDDAQSNLRIGNKWLYASKGGLTAAEAAAKLKQAGYITDEDNNSVYDVISESLSNPVYSIYDADAVAERSFAEQEEERARRDEQRRREGAIEAQDISAEIAAEQQAEAADLGNFRQQMLDAGYTEQDLNVIGFTKASPKLQAEVAALQESVLAAGLEPAFILETLEGELANRNITRQEYYAKAKARLEQAIQEKALEGGGRDVGQADVQEGAAREEVLALPSEQEVLEQPTSVQISSEQQKIDALNKFEAALSQAAPPFRAISASRTVVLRPQALSKKQVALIKDLAGEAIDLGMPASIFENVSAAGATRMGALAAISQESGWLLLGGQWNSSTRAEKLQALVHELGHSVDNKSAKSGKKVSEENQWQKAHDELKSWYNLSETKSTHPLNYPFNNQFIGKLNPKSESFAQAFSFYFVSPVDLQTNAPEAYSQIQSIVEGIQNESQRTGATGATKAGAAGVEVQPSRTQKGTEVQSKAGEVSAGISRTERVEDRGAVETDAFKRWFGDSKVVNDDGNPKVLYRGQRRDTGGADFDLRTRATPSFTDDVNVANVYSVRPTGELGRDSMVIPGYMRMEKPLDLRDYGSEPARLLDLLGDAGLWGRVDNTEIAKIVQDLSEQQFNTGFLSTNANDLDLDDVAQELSRAVAAKNEDRIAEILDETSVDPYALADSKVFVDAIKKQGRFDGIIVKDVLTDDLAEQAGTREYDTYRPFQTSQFKSTFNRGTFGDTENISFAQKPVQPASSATSWQAPDLTWKDTFIRKIADRNVDLKVVQNEITKQIGNLRDNLNAYQIEDQSHGRIQSQTADFLDYEFRPIIKEMVANNISDAELTKYLWMRHAPEANKVIAERNINNPDKQDGGSGVETAVAQRYMATLPADKKRKLESLAKQVDNILALTREQLEKNGIISKEELEAWESMFKHYVPLKREESDYALPTSTYRGVGPFSKSRTGSTSKNVIDILANVAINREIAIMRIEKERIKRAIYGLAVTNPNPGFWKAVSPDAVKNRQQLENELINMGISAQDVANIFSEPKTEYFNKTTGQVESRVDQQKRYSDYVLPVKIDGKDRFIFFNPKDERAMMMVTALKGMDTKPLSDFAAAMAPITRWFASVNTQYNLIFGLWNFARDLQGAAFNLTNTPLADKKSEVIKGALSALPELYKEARTRTKGGTPLSLADGSVQDFVSQGGKIGGRERFAEYDKSAQIVEKELSRLNRGNVKKAAYATLDWISNVNDMLENAVRLSSYRTALAQGMSKQQAADIAKNITVNFNRKGTVANNVGALYAFFNASVQGTARLAQTVDPRTKRGQKIMASLVGLGVIQAVALAMAGFDEDEPSEFLKQKNLIIPLGDKKYFMWPMPFGLNVFPNIGRLLFEGSSLAIRGKGVKDTVANMGSMLLNSFNPIGGGGVLQGLSPTATDPIVAIYQNRDAFDRPIAKEDQRSAPTPGFTRSRDPSASISQFIAQLLNNASGGTNYSKGLVSPTADQINYLAEQVGGGVYRELSRVVRYAGEKARGDETPEYRVPIVGKLVGSTDSPAAISQKFYSNVVKMSEHEDEIKGRIKDRQSTTQYMRDNPEASLWRRANTLENELTKINKRRKELVAQDAPKERIKQLDDQKTRMMKQFNDAVRQREGR